MLQLKSAREQIVAFEAQVKLLHEEWKVKNAATLKLEAVITSLRALLAQKDEVSSGYLSQLMEL